MVVNWTGFQNRWVPPPAKETVTKIMLGHPYSLELYRSLKSKTELLDSAVAVGDGNAMLAVRLWSFAFIFIKYNKNNYKSCSYCLRSDFIESRFI
jgi:hypothetical protein